MAILDNYNLRFNTATQILEMNIGGETWVPVPESVAPSELVLADTKILVGQSTGLAGAVSLSGGATIANTGVLTLGSTAVTGAALTGYVSGAGTVASTDTILQAINKLNGNTAAVSTVANAALPKAGGTMTGGFFLADQSASRGLLQFGAGATYLDGDQTSLTFVLNGTQHFFMTAGGLLELVGGSSLQFLAGAFGSDVLFGISAAADDVMEVNNGTPGTLRDIQVRNVQIGAVGAINASVGEMDVIANDILYLVGGNATITLWPNSQGKYISIAPVCTVGNDDVPAPSVALSVNSTTQGFLPPRMTTTQRDAITSPAAGLMIYNTSTNKLNVFTTGWEVITSA